ncbi:uncharacterized protein [Vicugna pacos]|uniref:Uncharacterized protein isoform X1 n=1 Tax=Vicugna pacos TaxID=30538 RepID=A0ABM5E5J4_VICPA
MPPLPGASPQAVLTPSAPTPPTQFTLYTNPLFLSWLIPALLLLLLLLWFICRLCCKKTVKEPPPTQERAKEPEETCPMQTCPTVIVPCGCQGGRMERMEGKLDHLCDFVQRCSQAPVMWRPPRAVTVKMPSCVGACDNGEKPDCSSCQPWNLIQWQIILLNPFCGLGARLRASHVFTALILPVTGRCISVALMKPHCGQLPCGPKICVQPSRERFPIKNFCSRCQHPLSMCPRLPSRMLPLIHPPAPSHPIVLRK